MLKGLLLLLLLLVLLLLLLPHSPLCSLAHTIPSFSFLLLYLSRRNCLCLRLWIEVDLEQSCKFFHPFFHSFALNTESLFLSLHQPIQLPSQDLSGIKGSFARPTFSRCRARQSFQVWVTFASISNLLDGVIFSMGVAHHALLLLVSIEAPDSPKPFGFFVTQKRPLIKQIITIGLSSEHLSHTIRQTKPVFFLLSPPFFLFSPRSDFLALIFRERW